MARIKIIIVEDELIIAQDLSFKLEDLGYHIIGIATNKLELEDIMEKEIPNLVLLDVELNTDHDGIDIGAYLRKKGNIPFVYLTSHADISTVSRAKETRPNGYILKPIQKGELFATLEMVLSRVDIRTDIVQNTKVDKQFFVQDKDVLVKVDQKDIFWLKAEGNYTEIHTKVKRYVIRGNIKETLAKLNDCFCRIHKSYAVNVNLVQKIMATSVWIDNQEIPIGKMYKEDFLINIQKL